MELEYEHNFDLPLPAIPEDAPINSSYFNDYNFPHAHSKMLAASSSSSSSSSSMQRQRRRKLQSQSDNCSAMRCFSCHDLDRHKCQRCKKNESLLHDVAHIVNYHMDRYPAENPAFITASESESDSEHEEEHEEATTTTTSGLLKTGEKDKDKKRSWSWRHGLLL